MADTSSELKNKERAEAFFLHGNDAAVKNNLDYAIKLYLDATRLVPEHLIYRQSLRGAERRKFQNDPKKVGNLIAMRLQPIRLRIKSEKALGHWHKVLEHCEEAFSQSPWDVATARDAAEAASHLGWYELAIWSLESVFAQGQSDAEFLRQIATTYERERQWKKAIVCWERVAKLLPSDDQARRKMKDLAASATITHGEYEERSKTPTEEAGEEVRAVEIAEGARVWKAVDPEERLLKEIESDPQSDRLYYDLSEHYKAHQKLDEAERILAKGVKAIPSSDFLRSARADVQITRLTRAIEAWTRKLQRDPDDAEGKAKLEQLTTMLGEYELKEFKRRLERSPEDAGLRMDYGERLAKLGRHDEAIAEFQHARSSPSLRVRALVAVAASFEAKELPKLAERNLQEALKHVDSDDPTQLKILHYRLGRLAELQEQFDSAEEHYNEVAAIEYSYLDIAERLQRLNLKRKSASR
jgi:tetratricopeptide (TPR) repeat protein